jgi:hypothetical protein
LEIDLPGRSFVCLAGIKNQFFGYFLRKTPESSDENIREF